MSHVRFASFVGTPEVAEISGTAFDTSISAQKPTEGARDDNDEGGGRVPLTRSHPRNEYSDAHFDHAAQFGYSTSTYQWSTRLSSTLQSRATSPVTERTYWYINNGRASGSGHVQAPNYTFHGSFAARPGDAIDMANEFVFECGPNATCVATLYSSYYVVS